MSATALLKPDSNTPKAPRPRVRLVLFSVIVIGWTAWLAWLTLETANPPLVNRVQVLASDLVLVGKWADRSAGRFDVSRELKHGKLTGVITVQSLPPDRSSASLDEEWVVPVRVSKNAYAVTTGSFPNRPENPMKAVTPEIDVKPQIYPATPDVLEQVAIILREPAAERPR